MFFNNMENKLHTLGIKHAQRCNIGRQDSGANNGH